MDQTIHAVVLILYLLVMLAIGLFQAECQTDYYLAAERSTFGHP